MADFKTLLTKSDARLLAKLLIRSAGRAASRMPEPIQSECRQALELVPRLIEQISNIEIYVMIPSIGASQDRLMQLLALHAGDYSKQDAKLILAACGYAVWAYVNYHGIEQISARVDIGNDVFEYHVKDALDYLADAVDRNGHEEQIAQEHDYDNLLSSF